MKKFDRYLDDLKSDMLQDFKKSLSDAMNASLKDLLQEKQEMTELIAKKKNAIKTQKEVMQRAKQTYEKRQKDEKVMSLVLHRVWSEAVDVFFTEHAQDWYRYALKKLPQQKGTVRYNPPHFGEQYVQMIRSQRPDLELAKDSSVKEGFVYESQDVYVDCTKEALSQEQFAHMKHSLYRKLKDAKVV